APPLPSRSARRRSRPARTSGDGGGPADRESRLTRGGPPGTTGRDGRGASHRPGAKPSSGTCEPPWARIPACGPGGPTADQSRYYRSETLLYWEIALSISYCLICVVCSRCEVCRVRVACCAAAHRPLPSRRLPLSLISL